MRRRHLKNPEENRKIYEYEPCGDGIRLTAYLGEEKAVAIPEEVDGFPVRVLGKEMFYENGLYIQSIDVPGTVRRIEPKAFEMCVSLEELHLSDGVEELGDNFLCGAPLKELIIPASVKQIGGIEKLQVRLIIDSKNPIYQEDGYGVYRRKVLVMTNPYDQRESYQVLGGCIAIAGSAFVSQYALREINLSASVRRIAPGALHNIKNPYLSVPGIRRVEIANDNPYYGSQDGIVYAGTETFSLIRNLSEEEEVILPEEFTEIEEEAFAGSRIKKLQLLGTITRIGKNAFEGTSLEEIMFNGTKIYFPQDDAYLRKELLECFGQNGTCYDYAYYDRILLSGYLNRDRLRMMLTRLEYPKNFNEGDRLRTLLSDQVEEAICILAKERDLLLLERFASQNFLSDQNIDPLIEKMNQEGYTEALAYLMNYKQEQLKYHPFDFSL
jgi:hypothetical protein